MSDTPADEASPAERWFRLAEQDLEAAKVLLGDGSAAIRIAAFLSQQAAEKALKAGLIAVGVHPPHIRPHIHGLRQLYDALLVVAPDLVRRIGDLELLDPWVIDGRYAADLPDVGMSEASDLLVAADKIVMRVRPLIPN
jgi:HEPN domain-containing protein